MAAHQASSSSSSGSSYEVFLSFHGMDVRTTFADHLYNALVYAGIRTFRDEDELPKGNDIGQELLAAIQQSRISIPIFSENYVSSKWCLNELTEICECRRTMGQIILPIYKVEPRDVRNQIGTYAKAFEEHQMRFDETTVQKWKMALREVGELDGWDSKKEPYEGKLIKEVVREVWSILDKKPLVVSNNLVGIQSHIKEMLMLLDIESNNRKIVGIHGIGGIGKTTIARTVYNTVFHHFEGYCFLENIQENTKKHGLPHLQNQLIFDILKQEYQNISVDDGINTIRQRFCQRKVLIVLDDVDQDNQAKSLVGDREWFGIGSKIIITSRNKDILIAQKTDEIYKPNVMNFSDSFELFSYHAFGRDQPPEGFLDISESMVKTTGGLPLALQVVGSSLYLKRKSIWDAILKKLQKVPNNDVMKRLKISYDGLDDEEQQMFLDTACFLIGMNKDIACAIWDGCGFFSQAGLDALCVRSLVTIGEEGELRMHDQIRDLGRQIVRQESIGEPGKHSRIWAQEDVLEVLDTQTGTNNVKGLSYNCISFTGTSRTQCLMSEGFAAMRKLRLLQVNYTHFSDNLFTHSFSELRWLSWKGCPDDQYVQTNFCPRKLVVLDLSYSKITKNWMGWNCIKMAVNLKVLNLMSCGQLSRIPDLSANQHLELLILEDCVNLVEIKKSIGNLRNLLILDLTRCEKLVDLPIENCQWTSLKRLDLKGCENLEKLPEKLCHMNSLTTLNLSGCKRLVDLPIKNCQLTSLKRLDLTGCKNLEKLPEKLGHMVSLTTLNLSGCEKLVDLPIEIDQLTSLERLDLSGCKNLNTLPMILGRMTSLTTLDLRRCKSLVNLPVEICQLTSLQTLKLSGCQSLAALPAEICKLISLEKLYLWGCKKLLHISNLPLSLSSLDVSNCSAIRYISGLPSSLTCLEAGGCESMEKLSSTSDLINLERLCLDSCNSLEEVEGVTEGLNSLVFFRILECKSLKKLPNLSNSTKLRELLISNCPELSKIEGLEDCESLETLTISEATSLKMLPNLLNLNKLQVLTIECCGELTEIPGLDRLEFLVKLDINWCVSLEKLPDLSNLKNLKELRANGCRKLTEIHGVQRLEFLELLDISGCESLERIPDLSNFENLNDLHIVCCKKLTEIHALCRLEFLVKLDFEWCEFLERSQKLSNLNNLNELRDNCLYQRRKRANDCKKLTEIHGVDRLNNLKELRSNDCKKLPEIHGVNRLQFLDVLDISRCKSVGTIYRFVKLKKN